MLPNAVEFVENFIKSNPGCGDVSVELNYIVIGLSMFSFLLSTVILFVYTKGDGVFLGIPFSIGILFFSAFVTMQAVLPKSYGNTYNIYILVVNIVIGILLNIYGSVKFFTVPTHGEQPLALQQSSISVIMLGITVPLCLMEMFLGVEAAKHSKFWQSAVVFTALIQKIIQVGIYHFSISHKGPVENRHHGASWYLKILALFNFCMWLQSIVDGNVSMKGSLKSVIPDGASVLAAVYSALVIDYRLLCCLLYIEFAFEVDQWDKHVNKDENVPNPIAMEPAWNTVNFRVLSSQYTGLGYLLGISIFIVQFPVALQFIKDPVGPWVNIFGVLADVLVICQGGALVWLAEYNEEESSWKEASSKGVHIMVALMGVVGLVFWILRSSFTIIFASRLSSYHEDTYQYLIWISLTNVVRIIGILFQLYFFFRITPSIGLRLNIRQRKVCYMLLPCIMLAQLSVFINSIIDSYSSIVEEFVHKAELNVVTSVTYKVGEPLHLGFCLHMFFHFFIVNNNLRRPVSVRGNVAVDEETDDEDDTEASQVERLLGTGMKYRTI